MPIPPSPKIAIARQESSRIQVSWEELKAQGIKFAYARAIYGTVKTDDNFRTYWPAMKEHNIIRGAYMFFRPANDLDTQVRLFAQAVDMDAGDLPPAVDLEFEQDRFGNEISLWPQLSTRASIDLVATLLQSVERTIGYKPVIYANHDFWTNQIYQGEINNKFTEELATSISKFQEKYHVTPIDGTCGRKTLSKLREVINYPHDL